MSTFCTYAQALHKGSTMGKAAFAIVLRRIMDKEGIKSGSLLSGAIWGTRAAHDLKTGSMTYVPKYPDKINSYLRATRPPRYDTLKQIADFFGPEKQIEIDFDRLERDLYLFDPKQAGKFDDSAEQVDIYDLPDQGEVRLKLDISTHWACARAILKAMTAAEQHPLVHVDDKQPEQEQLARHRRVRAYRKARYHTVTGLPRPARR